MQSLYEGRFASLERFVGFLVLFHALGKAVQDWWRAWSCGLLGYDMSRSHSIMRIATTASPVSGSEVRVKMLELAEETRRLWAVRVLQIWYRFLRSEKANWEVDKLKQEFAAMKATQRALEQVGSGKPQSAFNDLVEDAIDEKYSAPGNMNGHMNGRAS